MSAHLVEQTIQTYDEHAGTYDDETVEWWERFPEATLREFAGALRGRNVLSVGSGPGRDAERLREMGVEVTCLDASSAMVALTKMKGFDSRHARFEDAAKLFPPESFDGVWAFASLMHIPKEEAEAVIQDLHGLLKPGGIFAIGVLIGDSGGMEGRPTMSERYYRRYSAEELQATVEAHGFQMFHQVEYQPASNTFVCQHYRRVDADQL